MNNDDNGNGNNNEERDAYQVVGVSSDATDADIKKAFRQRSLKTHPDRNPHLKDAARLFHELTQAYELLLDPLRRMALDAKLRIREARKQRYANFDRKRKAMLEDLEAAEKEEKKAKSMQAAERQRYAQETEQIQDAGRRMVEERQAQQRRQHQEAERVERKAQEDLEPPLLGEHDTTVRLKYPLVMYPKLTNVDALHTFMATFGPIDKDSIVLSMKPPKKAALKLPKYATAAVPFKTITDAHAAVCASGRVDRGLENFEISWMGGCEPAVWSWSERMLKLKEEQSVNERKDEATYTISSTGVGVLNSLVGSRLSSFPPSFRGISSLSSPSTTPQLPVPGLDFESTREIREQEASEA
ncbi:hypothetical protein B0F90DRAFT_1725617 [Multifurca ochricompacta]|uniref:J domain-containing protein n=1 Tax=Multifurca ochricompacta TaxID=376703 RepID=A0AAD4QN94_9AGAM|nr:hypothetical protein B0F90DRAFT_1725617 [Multifurca ochricompacta]